MAINIESIQIQKLGPLSSIQLELGMLNLIYGHNESGKTYLVEFLLRSIFRHAKTWNLRDIAPEGSVNLQGLEDQTTIFSPTSSKKIEDFWNENERGLPLNMARLLVVKGGELALSNNSPGGVNRETLKNALTSQVLLDQIRGSIQSTVQKAQIIDQQVIGKDQGQINDRNILQNKLKDIDNLLTLIEEKYSRGPARQIEDQIEICEMEINQQLKAKKHHAYLLSKKQKELRKQRDRISDDSFLALRDRVRDHKKLKLDLENLTEKIGSSQAETETYHWLESAVNIWEEKGLENKRLPEKSLLIIGAGLLFIGLIITFAQNILFRPDLFWPGIISASIGSVLLAYFGIQLLVVSKNAVDTREQASIRFSYKEKFNRTLTGITDLRMQQNKLQANFLKTKSMQEEFGKLEIQLETARQRIKDTFSELLGETIKEDSWETNLEAIKHQSLALDEKISDLAIEITKLNLDENEYLVDPQDQEYDPQILADLEEHLTGLTNQLHTHQSDLDTLKVRAAEWTRDDISIPWSDILHRLRTMRNEISQSLINLTAELVAKIGLTEILRIIELEEDQKILNNINTGEVSTFLKKLTGKYQRLNLIDDQIYASDPYQEYPLRDLSTGAKEQIQLSLRLGIASHVSGGEALFIILDDAFQHSDWDRRESLVKATVDLAKNNWQVIYLTMDNHIRDLFLKIGKAALKRNFVFFEI